MPGNRCSNSIFKSRAMDPAADFWWQVKNRNLGSMHLALGKTLKGLVTGCRKNVPCVTAGLSMAFHDSAKCLGANLKRYSQADSSYLV